MNLVAIPWTEGAKRCADGEVLHRLYAAYGKTLSVKFCVDAEKKRVLLLDPWTLGHPENPMSEEAYMLTTALTVMPPPPNPSDYFSFAKAAAKALFGLRERRRVLREVSAHAAEFAYLLDRLTGRYGFSGYGVFEAAVALDAVPGFGPVTEVVLPVQVEARPFDVEKLPKGLKDVVEQIKVEVEHYARMRNVVIQCGDHRLSTNIHIAESDFVIKQLVRRLVPDLTLERPFGTREDVRYKARIASDILYSNVNVRKMGAVPVPRVIPSNPAPHPVVMGLLAYKLFWQRRGEIISGAMGSGKTYQLNSLLYLAPPHVQIVVVERGAKEIWTPLSNQVLHITAMREEDLERALDQALRYGTAHTVIVLGEARTAKELYYLVMYTLTGHGNATTMHAEDVQTALTRIAESKAPIEGLEGFVAAHFGLTWTGSGYVRMLKEVWEVSKDYEAEHPRLKEYGLGLRNPLKMAEEERQIVMKLAAVYKTVAEASPTPHEARGMVVEAMRRLGLA